MKQFSNFSLQLYTEIVFGKDTESQAGALIHKHSGTKVLMVYGGGSIKKNGLYDRVVASLNEAGISFAELSGVQPNPRRTMVDKGVALAKAENVDFILAVGGGSTLDTSKAIGYALQYDGDWWDLYSGKAKPTSMTPVGSIHTITAAGSETSTNSVIVDDVDTFNKAACGSPIARPVFAIMNPELTYSVSPYQTGVGASDVFAHTLERYFYQNDCALGDEFAEGLMRTVVKYGPIAYRDGNSYEARAELMLAGSFSHNDITGIGHAGRRGGPHPLELHLSGSFDNAHGAGLAVIMPAWLKLVADSGDIQCARVAKLAITVFGVSADLADLRQVAYEGIERFKSWLRRIGMPLTLRELGLAEKDIPTMVEKARTNKDGILAGYIDIRKEDLPAFYKSIL